MRDEARDQRELRWIGRLADMRGNHARRQSDRDGRVLVAAQEGLREVSAMAEARP